MRARYYSPEMKRFINADIIAGAIDNAITLNRFAYANGNPISFVDPFGFSAERGMTGVNINRNYVYRNTPFYNLPIKDRISIMESVADIKSIYDEYSLYSKYGYNIYRKGLRAYVIGGKSANLPTTYRKSYYDISKISKASNVDDYWDILKNVDVSTGLKSELSLFKPSGKINGGAILNYAGVALDVGLGIAENIEAGTDTQRIITDAAVDAGFGVGIIAGSTAIGSAVGSIVPVAGNIIGAGVGFLAGVAIDWAVDTDIVGDKSLVDLVKDGVDAIADGAVELAEAAGDVLKDAGEAIDHFFEDTGNAVRGFFSGLFG